MAHVLVDKICWALPLDLRKVLLVTAEDSTSFCMYFSQANLRSLRASMQLPDLWLEAAMLRRLLYKNQNQHRSSIFMRRLREVARELQDLQDLQLPQLLEDLHTMTQLSSDPSAVPGSGSRHGHRVPAQEAAAFTMQRLLLGCTLMEGLVMHGLQAADQVAAQVAKSFFMPLGLTALAMLARIQVLCMQLMLACITAYNALADLLPLLPSASPVGTAIQHKATLLALPSMLRCTWQANLPRCERVEGQDGAGSPPGFPWSESACRTMSAAADEASHERGGLWVLDRARQVWDDLGIMQGLEVVDLGRDEGTSGGPAAIGAAKAQAGAMAPQAHGTDHSRKQSAAAPSAPLQQKATLKRDAQDLGTKVDRRSFYDLITAKPERQQRSQVAARSSAAQPSAALGVIDDRVGRKRQRQSQKDALHKQHEARLLQGEQPQPQQLVGRQEAQGPVPVVYATALSGFTLGLGRGPNRKPPSPPQQQEAQPESTGLSCLEQQQLQQHQSAQAGSSSQASFLSAPQQQPQAEWEAEGGPTQVSPRDQPTCVLPSASKVQLEARPVGIHPPQWQQTGPAFLRVGTSVGASAPPGSPKSAAIQPTSQKPDQANKKEREGPPGNEQPQLSLLDALSNKKRKKPKPPPAQEPVNKARAWDDLLPAVALVGKDKKKQKG